MGGSGRGVQVRARIGEVEVIEERSHVWGYDTDGGEVVRSGLFYESNGREEGGGGIDVMMVVEERRWDSGLL